VKKPNWKASIRRWKTLYVAHCRASLPPGHAHSNYSIQTSDNKWCCGICYHNDPIFKEKVDGWIKEYEQKRLGLEEDPPQIARGSVEEIVE
jgi:hypothetical protein